MIENMPLQLRYTIINKNLILISFQKEFNNFLQGPYQNIRLVQQRAMGS